MIRYMANRNNGHPFYDHGLKRKTFLVDPRWLAQRIGFHLIPSSMQLSNNVRSAPVRSKLLSRFGDQSSKDSQNQIASL